jgi:hypothetical protein
MGTKDPSGLAPRAAIFVAGQQVAKFVPFEFYMRNIAQNALDLRPDMILMKGCRGLLEKSLEDAR